MRKVQAIFLPVSHAELVSASRCGRALVLHGRDAQARRKIVPVGILALDYIDLPLTMPTFELLFAFDRFEHRFK
jgi:hypothetical protein